MISKSSASQFIDLRGTPCPINFIRCRLAIEDLAIDDYLEVYLDKGEPQEMVTNGLQNEGHLVEIIQNDSTWVKLMVVCGVT
mgnify:CR=1 FL=1